MDWSTWATALASLKMPFLVAYFAYVFVSVTRLRTVRGSRQRMILRTIERPMRWVAATTLVLLLLSSIVTRDVLGLITAPLAIVIWTKVWALDRGDDDDYWRQGGRWLKSRRSARRVRLNAVHT